MNVEEAAQLFAVDYAHKSKIGSYTCNFIIKQYLMPINN